MSDEGTVFNEYEGKCRKACETLARMMATDEQFLAKTHELVCTVIHGDTVIRLRANHERPMGSDPRPPSEIRAEIRASCQETIDRLDKLDAQDAATNGESL